VKKPQICYVLHTLSSELTMREFGKRKSALPTLCSLRRIDTYLIIAAHAYGVAMDEHSQRRKADCCAWEPPVLDTGLEPPGLSILGHVAVACSHYGDHPLLRSARFMSLARGRFIMCPMAPKTCAVRLDVVALT
jgi:hypothetical protein